MVTRAEQPSLFELPPRELEAAAPRPEDVSLAAQLPGELRLGTMSWSFAGWRGRGLVYGESAEPKLLAEAGLAAYAKHPLLSAVEIDRSFYEPLPLRYFEATAAQVPTSFRFLVKAHEELTLRQFPKHARYGKKQGESNSRYLDAAYATDAVIAPTVEGLGSKLSALLFQFSPQGGKDPGAFADQLQDFLERLPKVATYAVELRDPELLTPRYTRALLAGAAVHAHNVWGNMPPVTAQARVVPPAARRPLIVRWLMRRGDDYEGARSRFLPFSRLAEPDLPNRSSIADLIARALAHDVPALVVVNNKAEGCAPATIAELAREIARREAR
jgi:uncharacterized protein YecE (DUF72 family)